MFAFVVAGMTLVSCSSDDDSGAAPTIEGKWNQTKTVTKIGSASSQTQDYSGNEAGCEKDYIQFVASGVLRDVILFKDAQNNCQENAGTEGSWSKSDDNLTIEGGDFAGSYTITKLSASNLVIVNNSTQAGQDFVITYYFDKASN